MTGEGPEIGSLAHSPGTWPAAVVSVTAIAIISNLQAVPESEGVGTQPHPWQLLVPRVPRLPSMSMGTVQPKLAPYKVTAPLLLHLQPHPGVDSGGGACLFPSSSGRFGVRWRGECAGSVTTFLSAAAVSILGNSALPHPPTPRCCSHRGLVRSSSGEGLPSLAWRPLPHHLSCHFFGRSHSTGSLCRDALHNSNTSSP